MFLINLCFLVPFLGVLHGETFNCLEKCHCDTLREEIFCEDQHLSELPLPPGKEKLLGFEILNLKNNSIVNLPSEQRLLERFPHLEAIQLAQNRHFNCSSLSGYRNLTITHDCLEIYEVEVGSSLFPENLGDERSKNGVRDSFGAVLLKYVIAKYENFDSKVALERLKSILTTLKDVFNEVAPTLSVVLEIFRSGKQFKEEMG